MIEFDNVTKQYPDGTVAIEGISFEVEAGTTTVLVGPSGCGKTTTMKLVNRLEDPTEGTVYYDGTDIEQQDEIELRRDIGYVIQEIGLFNHMTVRDNVATVPDLRGWDDDRIDERVDELLELMDLPPETYRSQYPSELSGGQRQRVGIARALAAEPDVMLMDEPFGALDPITRESLQDEFLEIQEHINTTIIFVTHDINEALKMGDKIAIYNVGEIVQYGTPEEILQSPANEFVEDFIGADRALKQLQVLHVEDVMEESGPAEATVRDDGRVDLPSTNGQGIEPISASVSTQVALSQMIQHDVDVLPVGDAGQVDGWITREGIHRATQMDDGVTN
ncbi:ABC transporter ATP-binding protein [Halorarius halobius]|uniref:ABC transporter ATP-binding protein n=1 Tax=Halorarius halobius TaxID=2962671 RepID=UPI0020CEE8EB|nr:ABC transporter ATP-binding protein [Halorarius halobius]